MSEHTAVKPSVYSLLWRNLSDGELTRRWHVEFVDNCGFPHDADFDTFLSATRFAYHIAMGGHRWQFVA